MAFDSLDLFVKTPADSHGRASPDSDVAILLISIVRACRESAGTQAFLPWMVRRSEIGSLGRELRPP